MPPCAHGLPCTGKHPRRPRPECTTGATVFAGWTERGAILRRHPAAPEQKQLGLTFDDAGGNYRVGDFTWTFWGYGERIFNTGSGKDYWRRVRQGSEFDLPQVTINLRPAIVYRWT